MWRTTSPISSMCPITASSGPSPLLATRAHDDPTTSPETSANPCAASRHARAGSVSYPEGPGALRSDRRTSGIGMAGGYWFGLADRRLQRAVRRERRAGGGHDARRERRAASRGLHEQVLDHLLDPARVARDRVALLEVRGALALGQPAPLRGEVAELGEVDAARAGDAATRLLERSRQVAQRADRRVV